MDGAVVLSYAVTIEDILLHNEVPPPQVPSRAGPIREGELGYWNHQAFKRLCAVAL